MLNPFHASGLFLYSLKTTENLCFYVFSGYRKRPMMDSNGFKVFTLKAIFVVLCAIWYHLNVKNTHEGVLILACNFTKINTPPCVFFMFFKLYKWYQIAQCITFIASGVLLHKEGPLKEKALFSVLKSSIRASTNSNIMRIL